MKMTPKHIIYTCLQLNRFIIFLFHCFHENDISIYDMFFFYIFNLVDYFYMNIKGTQSHKQAKNLKKVVVG
jgi:hypothetical protein